MLLGFNIIKIYREIDLKILKFQLLTKRKISREHEKFINT